MRSIELYWGRYADTWVVFHVLSCEFAICPDILSLKELEDYLRKSGPFFVKNRYAEQPYGEAGTVVQAVLALFEKLKLELGPDFFDYACLPREQITLDFTGCATLRDVYGEMRRKMAWQDFYGENLDALWDILTGMPYKGDDFTILLPKQFENIPYGQNQFFTEYVDKICSILQEAQDRDGEITVTIRRPL